MWLSQPIWHYMSAGITVHFEYGINCDSEHSHIVIYVFYALPERLTVHEITRMCTITRSYWIIV